MKATIIGLLLFHPIQAAGYHLLKEPYLHEETRPVISYIRENYQEGDTLYIYYSSVSAFKYYQRLYGFAGTAYITGIRSRKNWQNYLDDLDKCRGRKRLWILLSHFYRGRGIDERVLLLDHLDRIGTRRATVKAYGAEGYLYDLGDTAPSQAVAR
jgi:hypothetical protein